MLRNKNQGGGRKKPKQRPPRIYRAKDGRPYIKLKGKRVYLDFGEKTNDLSTLQIVKLFLKYMNKPNQRGPKRRKTKNKEDLRKVQSLSEIEQNTRTAINDHLDKLRKVKYDQIEEIDKKEQEEKKRRDRKDIADAEERKEMLDREQKRELAEIKKRQDEKAMEMRKEQRLSPFCLTLPRQS